MSTSAGRWWRGEFDVESFAIGAVVQVCEAATAIAKRRGSALNAVSTTPELVAASYAAVDHLLIDGRAGEGWAPLSGFAEAADGWVRLHGNYPHHAQAIGNALGVDSRDRLVKVVGSMPAEDVVRRVVDANGIATVVRSEPAWNMHPHGAATRDDPWYTEELGEQRRPLGMTAAMPLHGVKVLDLTRVIAGPTCSQVLACLGADVLRLDPPDRPELVEQYLSNGMGKRSAEVDLRTNADQVRAALLPQADVVLLGYRPGSLTKFGFDPTSLLQDNPTLVIGSLSAWGEHGPWGQRAGFDSIVQAASGIADACGRAGRPGALPVQALDHATGYLLAARVVALLDRNQSGIIRASLLGAARTLLRDKRSPSDSAEVLPVPTVTIPSPYGSHRGASASSHRRADGRT